MAARVFKSGVKERRSAEKTLSNGQLSLYLRHEASQVSGHWAHALKKAARKALLWPEEASLVKASGVSLTSLDGIGTHIEKLIEQWFNTPPEGIDFHPDGTEFLTMAEARRLLARNPEWAKKINGDLQMHTRWSDGETEIAVMAQEGIARNYQYIAITDHTKGLKIAGGINEEQLLAQGREIQALNRAIRSQKINFTVLKSAEVNLSVAGEVDMKPSALRKLDIVLGAFHSSLRKTDDQTARYMAAIRNPNIQILGHPQTRIYNYRAGLNADWHRVFAEAARLDKAVEIDGYADRQDLKVSLLKIARLEGGRISMGTDSHHPWQMDFIAFSLAAALKAKIPAERVINFLTASQLKEWVQNVRET